MSAHAGSRGSIERRGSAWWLRRSLPELLGDGRVRRKPSRVKLGTTRELRSAKAARRAADLWIARTRIDEVAPGPTLAAVEYCEHFIRTSVALMRPGSRAHYCSVIRKHLLPAAAGRKLVELDTPWIRGFIARRAAMQRATLAGLRKVLLQILRQARRDGYGACRIDPSEVRLPRRTHPGRAPRAFSIDEAERIVAAAPPPWCTLYGLMAFAGLRIGEALGLEYQDLDLERGVLRIRQQAVRGKLAALKTLTSSADVPILPALAPILRAQVCLRLTRGSRVGVPGELAPTELVFVSQAGTPLFADDVRRRRLQPLLRALGIAHAGCHAFRHGLPERLERLGASASQVAAILRHGSVRQTEAYLHGARARGAWAGLAALGVGRETVTAAPQPGHTRAEIPARPGA